MPTLDVRKDQFWSRIGTEALSDQQLDDICFAFGIERDASVISLLTIEELI
ncbi:MAG: hypothetical protein MHMPM18_004828 [Marteilia pararefringens]